MNFGVKIVLIILCIIVWSIFVYTDLSFLYKVIIQKVKRLFKKED